MPTITFVDTEGAARAVVADVGASLMEAARANGIPGIDAVCGGLCACATCHVYVAADFLAQLPRMEDGERSLLEFVDERRPNSRLACQLRITAAFDGLRVATPASQG